MGDIEVMGDGGLGLLRDMSLQKAQCVVPTFSNAQCMHFHPEPRLRQDTQEIGKQREILSLYDGMRIAATDTCIPYQTVYQPKLGEHVAWGDTGTVIYANSVLGARTNFEAGKASQPVCFLLNQLLGRCRPQTGCMCRLRKLCLIGSGLRGRCSPRSG